MRNASKTLAGKLEGNTLLGYVDADWIMILKQNLIEECEQEISAVRKNEHAFRHDDKSQRSIEACSMEFLSPRPIHTNILLQFVSNLITQTWNLLPSLTSLEMFTQAAIGSNTCCTLASDWLKPGKRKNQWVWRGHSYPFLNMLSSREVYDLSWNLYRQDISCCLMLGVCRTHTQHRTNPS